MNAPKKRRGCLINPLLWSLLGGMALAVAAMIFLGSPSQPTLRNPFAGQAPTAVVSPSSSSLTCDKGDREIDIDFGNGDVYKDVILIPVDGTPYGVSQQLWISAGKVGIHSQDIKVVHGLPQGMNYWVAIENNGQCYWLYSANPGQNVDGTLVGPAKAVPGTGALPFTQC